jgi:hypothetical protein
MEKRMSMKTNHKSVMVLLLTVSVIFGACKSSRNVVDKTDDLALSKTLIAKVKENDPAIKSLNIKKMNVALTLGGKKINSPAFLRMIKDTVIYVSVQPFLGVEMFVAQIDKENIVVVDKTKNTSYKATFKFLSDYLGSKLDFETLQNLLLNQYFLLNEGLIDSNKTGVLRDKTVVKGVTFENEKIAQKVTLSETFRVAKQDILFKKNENRLITSYMENVDINGESYPAKIRFTLSNTDGSSSFELQINQAEINQPVSVPVLNTFNLRQAALETLLKIIK